MSQDKIEPTAYSGRREPVLAIVVPCHNEEEALSATITVLAAKLRNLAETGIVSRESYILYVDDGSTDRTWSVIEDSGAGCVRGIRLTRNCGQQTALMAGMERASEDCDVCITIDADLQDDVDAIDCMIGKYRQGADVVYGVRKSRASDTRLKRGSAHTFYRLMGHLGVECVYNHADYRLLSREALRELMRYEERNLFLRGIMPLLGLRQESVYYERRERKAGRSKYPLPKMMDFAIDGITSFSVRPVRMLFWMGLLFVATAFAIGVYAFIRHFSGETIEGWTSLILSIWFCTGTLLVGLGIVGEYIGKIYIEVKHRPRYSVSCETGFKEDVDIPNPDNGGSEELEKMELIAELHA